MNFSLSEYKKLLLEIKNFGYKFTDYCNYKDVEKACILRHDVDFSLKKAVEFAEYESDVFSDERISSTYFILLSTDFYNVFTKENKEYLKNILACGHNVGLHFDETQYEINGDSDILIEKILYEIDILSDIIQEPVKCVSMHRPSQNLLEKNIKIPDVINSYGDKFFNKFKYLSDSRMHWREDPYEAISSNKYSKLHILTHPFWYKEGTLPQQLMRFIRSAALERYELLNNNFRNLENEVKWEEVEKIVDCK